MEKPNLHIEIGSIVSEFGLILLREVARKDTEKLGEELVLKFNHAQEKAVKGIVDVIKSRIGL